MVTKKVSQEFIERKSRFLAPLCKLDEQSKTVSGTSRNMKVEKLVPTKESFQYAFRTEVDASVYQSAQSMHSDTEETSTSQDMPHHLLQAADNDNLIYTGNLKIQNSDVQGYPLPVFEDQN